MPKKIKKFIGKAGHKLDCPNFGLQAKELGIPSCSMCGAPLLAGFGDSTGDYYLCLDCGAIVPVNQVNEC